MNQAEILTSEQTVVRTRTRLNAILCALLVAFCVLLTHPVLEMGINDEPSYVRTALDFARTGHFVYNGWATAILGWQVIWGAIFIKVFGFSFTVLRLSTLPIAMACVYLLHQILVRFGINQWNAVIGTLAIALSPVFLGTTVTFMTDIPGLFCVLICLYLCQRALLAQSASSAILYLSLAAFSNVAGGTVRQIAWLGALVLVPCCAWLLRRRPGLLLTGAILWVASAASIFLCMHWFKQQPYSIPDRLFNDGFSLALLRRCRFKSIEIVLSTALDCLPILVAFLPAIRRLSRRRYIALCLTLVAVAVVLLRKRSDYFLPNFFSISPYEVFGFWPSSFSSHLVVIIYIVSIASGVTFLMVVLSKVQRLPGNAVEDSSLSWHQCLTLIVPFTLASTVLMLPVSHAVFSRYLLTIMVSITILLLRFYQERVSAKVPVLSIVTLAIFAIWGVAGTHDLFSMDRARLAAAEEVHRAGISRTLIQGGFEYDFWTQLESIGHINDERIEVPRGAYRPQPTQDPLPLYRTWYASNTPAVQPRYFLAFSPQPFLKPAEFAPVPFRMWLPPSTSTIYVEQLP